MIYNNQIHNFEDFNARFGYKRNEKGDILFNKSGAPQRKNNIIYQFYKESFLALRKRGYSLKYAFEHADKYNSNGDIFKRMLNDVFKTRVEDICPVTNFGLYTILNNGICVDGDISSIRYKNNGHVYKMKIGKYVNKYLDDPGTFKPFWINNSTLRIFFIEELTELWKNKRLKESTLKLVIDTNFEKSYNPDYHPDDQYDFHSCMDGRDNYHFYINHQDIFKTVRLEDETGQVYARANLITCFFTHNDSKQVLLERIYANKRCYIDLLFEKAKNEKICTIYKDLNASCSEADNIRHVDTDNLIKNHLYIPICLGQDDYLAYQDTFKWYYPSTEIAYNYYRTGYCYNLDTTSLYYDSEDD